LPEEELHCATLASGTLQEAVRLYLVGNAGNMRDPHIWREPQRDVRTRSSPGSWL